MVSLDREEGPRGLLLLLLLLGGGGPREALDAVDPKDVKTRGNKSGRARMVKP